MLDTLPTVATPATAAFDAADAANQIAGARTRAEFIAACRAVVDASLHVRLRPKRLRRAHDLVSAATPISWAWYVRPEPETLSDAAFDLVALAAPNGGYFYTTPDGGVAQWAHEGSGTKALHRWTQDLARDRLLPGVDLHDPETARRKIAPRLEGVPYASSRLEIAADLARAQRRARLDALLDAARTPNGTWRLTLEVADHLAAIYPAAFAEDPFRKKAILALIMLHGYLHNAGERVESDLPLPADYQLPRIFNFLGALEIAPELTATLRSGDRLLDVESPEVVSLRAAAVVLAARLAQDTEQPDGVVDGALFTTYRKDPAFLVDSLPAMRCDTLWF